jgi:hypothetical protein
MVRRKHPLEGSLDDNDTLLMLANGESILADLKLGENHFTLNTSNIIVKAVERVAVKHQAPVKTPDITLVFEVPQFKCAAEKYKTCLEC